VVIGPLNLVTNCHVLEKVKTVWIQRENVLYQAKRADEDKERDLCLLSVANFSSPAVTIAPLAEVKVGQRVYAIGNSLALTATLSEGLVSGLRGDDSKNPSLIQTSAPISPGSSGGGLFDERGRLVGITTLSLTDRERLAQNLNFATPAEWIDEVATRAQERLVKQETMKAAAATRQLAATAPAEGMPSVGATWKYSFRDRRYNHARTFTVRITSVEGWDVRESIDVLGGSRSSSMTNARDVMFLPRHLVGGDSAMELAPYFYSSELRKADAGFGPGGYPGSGSWRISRPRIETEATTVPAGSYKALRVTVTGELPQYGVLGGSAAGSAAGTTSRFEYIAWYAPEVHRYVRVQHKTWNPNDSLIGDEVVQLLEYHE
jgi:hypothetical protein